MDANRILKGAVIVLLCVAAVQLVRTGESQAAAAGAQRGATQPFPGPGSGVVDVNVVNDLRVIQQGEWRAVQLGEWRVAQQGDWRVGVQGNVTTVPMALPFFKVGSRYTFQWAEHWFETGTVREMHASGWVRLDSRWVNPANAIAIEPR